MPKRHEWTTTKDNLLVAGTLNRPRHFSTAMEGLTDRHTECDRHSEMAAEFQPPGEIRLAYWGLCVCGNKWNHAHYDVHRHGLDIMHGHALTDALHAQQLLLLLKLGLYLLHILAPSKLRKAKYVEEDESAAWCYSWTATSS